MVKKVIDIDAQSNPHLQEIHKIISQAIDLVIANQSDIVPISSDVFIKQIEGGKLTFNDMENDMKISKSRFYRYKNPQDYSKEMLIQISGNKLAVFDLSND